MRVTKPASVFLALTVGFMGIYWVACYAQEKAGLPLGPPPVLPPAPVEAPKPVAAPRVLPARSIGTQGKPDATLIIPAAVYEEPRVLPPAKGDERRDLDVVGPARIVQAGALQPAPPVQGGKVPASAPPAPAFPVLPIAPAPEGPKEILPPPPALPVQLPEPSKTLILEPLPKPSMEAPKGTAPLAPTPVLIVPRARVPEEPSAPPGPARPAESKGFVRIRTEPEGPAPLLPAPARNDRPLPPNAPLPLPGSASEGSLASSVQCPAIRVEKRGPAAVRGGETVSYQIVVRNQGSVPAQEIRIEDDLPADARFLSAEPMPILHAGKVAWTLPALAANKEQQLRLTLQAMAPIHGPYRTNVQVKATNQVTTVDSFRPPMITNALAVELIAPRQIAVGKRAVFEIRVVNQSPRPLSGMVLHGILPAGLDTPEGRMIEGEVGGALQPGESKTLRMPTRAVQVGRYTVEARVTTSAGLEASSAASIDIAADTLQVRQPATVRLGAGQEGDVRIDIVNPTDRTMRNVAVSSQLPEGVDCVTTTDRGLYQANSRTVHWLFDSLPAGATRSVNLRLYGGKAGSFEYAITARADGVAPVQSAGAIVCEAAAELSLRIDQKDRVIEIGRETAFNIEVQNTGNAPANRIRLEILFPPGLVPRNAQGRLAQERDGRQKLVLEKATLRPQEKIAQRIAVLAQQKGDQRVRFAVVSEQMPTPIQRETSTLVYRD